MSTKAIKSGVKEEVKFDFKIKGQKPIITKDICQFNITGQDLKEEKLVEVLKKFRYKEME